MHLRRGCNPRVVASYYYTTIGHINRIAKKDLPWARVARINITGDDYGTRAGS